MCMATQSKQFQEKQKKLEIYKKELVEKATIPELIFKSRLEDSGIKFIFQKGFIGGNNFCIADFYIPSVKLVIEIDGGYHRTPEQKLRDANKDDYYKSRGFSVLRLWNSEVETFDLAYLIKSKAIPKIKVKPHKPTNREKAQKKMQLEYKKLVRKDPKEIRDKLERLREKHAEVLQTVPLGKQKAKKLSEKELNGKYRTDGNGISDKK